MAISRCVGPDHPGKLPLAPIGIGRWWQKLGMELVDEMDPAWIAPHSSMLGKFRASNRSIVHRAAIGIPTFKNVSNKDQSEMVCAAQLRSKLTGYTGTTRDFDFLAGSWDIKNRRLKHRNVGSDEWDEFDASQSAWLMLDSVANVDEFDCPARGFKGMSMRTLDLEAHQWWIYWINSTFGKLLPPVIGGFRGAHGLFYGDDEDAGESLNTDVETILYVGWRRNMGTELGHGPDQD